MTIQGFFKMETIKKQTQRAFRKKVYLLGIDKDNQYFWLESPSFDCGWYWGFGYIERYTNNKNPSVAKDITSHSHFKGEIIGQQDFYDSEKGCFRQGDYKHHLNEHDLKASVLSESESWKLSELMNSFYILQETAGFFKSGSAGVTENPLSKDLKNKSIRKKINEVLLPKIFKEIDKLLSP